MVFKLKFTTNKVIPDTKLVLRAAQEDTWNRDVPGIYRDGAWEFILDEDNYSNGIQFKFVILPNRWMKGANLHYSKAELANGVIVPEGDAIFDPDPNLAIENGFVAQKLLNRNVDETHTYDVIIVGSGMGGGILASALADHRKDVLVLEAGSLLFPSHVGNLPRRMLLGKFQKHIWSLWYLFRVQNYQKPDGSPYDGEIAQGFNLGGRSIFWGSFIPPLAGWEFAAWPNKVSEWITQPDASGMTGYDKARRVFNADLPTSTPFDIDARGTLAGLLSGWNAVDAPVAVEYVGATNASIPAGIFSTADLLLEDVLVDTANQGRTPITVNLNHAVQKVLFNGTAATSVQCYDLLARKQRTYKANRIVLCAGTVESAKIAMNSGINNGKIGKGITDHTILYRHFLIPASYWTTTGHSTVNPAGLPQSAKVLLTHPQATKTDHAFDILVEFGAQYNQGRYVDPDNVLANVDPNGILCEIVFQFFADLDDSNKVELTSNDPGDPVKLTVKDVKPSQALQNEARDIATTVFQHYQAQPVDEGDLYDPQGKAILSTAKVGGVAHEVGTLRMSADSSGVVDGDLKFIGYDNLYACDNSVFPVSPAGNPSLTLCALSLRLADHLA